MFISRIAQSIPPSKTLEITERVNEKKSQGANVLSFGAGQPDFDTPENIKKAAVKALDEGFTKYTAVTGIPPLRKAIAEVFQKQLNLNYDPGQIIVGNGAKQVLATAVMALCNPDDQVIVLSPYWVSYPEMVKMAGATPCIVPLAEGSFQLNMDAIKRAVSPKTRAIIINTPSNPTGSVFSKDSLEELAELAVDNNIFVISDEVYDFLLYDGEKHVSIATLGQEIKDKTLVVNAVSKKYAMTGWRIGFGAGPLELIKAMGRLQGHYTSNPNSIAQKATIEALTGDQSSVDQMIRAFTQRRDYLYERLSQMKGISLYKPQGAFYAMPSIKEILGRSYEGKKIGDDFDFCTELLEAKEVALVPGGAFGASGYVRISFATSMEEIQEGMDRMEDFIDQIFV